jgi:nitrous-oxide reductase
MEATMRVPKLLGAATAAALAASACGERTPSIPGQQTLATADVQNAALRTFIAPGDMDEYYLFYSGGHSGQVFVAGVPSMRHIATIPVFTPYPGTGYGFDETTKAMLGDFTWGDVHHPAVSKTDGDYDGRWLFVNDNANNRLARISLRDFKTKQILGPIPNTMGNHGSAMITDNSEYALVATRFSVPVPNRFVPVEDYATDFKGAVTGVRIDPEDGTMSVGWQILTPPFNWDLGATGKGPSDGWAFWSSYNSERATGKLEITASQRDRDYMAVVNWRLAEQLTEQGRGQTIAGVQVLDPAQNPGVMFLVPCAKSPHGADVDPSGQYVICSGKLSPTVTVYSFDLLRQAIENEDFTGEEDGIPVLNYDNTVVMEVPIGLGPLHTQFDGRGNAYTSLFVESSVAKWRLPPYEEGVDPASIVLEKIPSHFNIGHLVTSHGDTRSPRGDYLIAMNKLSKGRHLSVGPSIPESSQLIDIAGEGMAMLYEAFTEPEPHFAQLVHASVLDPIEFYPREENTHEFAIWEPADASVERNAARRTVEAKVYTIRTHFEPSKIQVQEGDTVIVHATNAEQQRDEIHGFAVVGHNVNMIIDPGETKTMKFVARRGGVYPFYCTNFCSALHQEMQGYFEVVPRGQALTMYGPGGDGPMQWQRRDAGSLAAAGAAHEHGAAGDE